DSEATLFQGALEAAGVRAHVVNGGAVYPGLWWDTARILVSQTDAEQAAAILRELERSRAGRRHLRMSRTPFAFARSLFAYFIAPLVCALLVSTRLKGWAGICCLLVGLLAATTLYRLFAPPRPSR
ncbi:MAG TPA: hypothetical protein VMR25_12965, partial [Planctomycetaceae bacterium]|nr:hypothetical protein [Planctomycetaceae bacterium]